MDDLSGGETISERRRLLGGGGLFGHVMLIMCRSFFVIPCLSCPVPTYHVPLLLFSSELVFAFIRGEIKGLVRVI